MKRKVLGRLLHLSVQCHIFLQRGYYFEKQVKQIPYTGINGRDFSLSHPTPSVSGVLGKVSCLACSFPVYHQTQTCSEEIRVRSFGIIQIRINDPRSLGSWCIKGTEESLMHHDPSHLRSLILIWIIPKERDFCSN